MRSDQILDIYLKVSLVGFYDGFNNEVWEKEASQTTSRFLAHRGIELTFMETGENWGEEQGVGRRSEDFGFVNVQFEMP